MRFFFFGSGVFAGDILRILMENRQFPQAVITRVDRPGGRGRRLRSTPVKILAEEAGLELMQPCSISEEAFHDTLKTAEPEVILLADYGELLPPALILLPPKGCVNVHPSLLPQYRGASPVQRTLMDGRDITGVTLMLMEEGLDTGPIIFQESMAVEEDDNAGSLSRKLADLGGRLLVSKLPDYISGEIIPRPQEESEASYAEPIEKADLPIDWSRRARALFNQIRALSPSPGAYTYLRDKRVKILRAIPAAGGGGYPPGTISLQDKDRLIVVTGDGALLLEWLQPEGKKLISAGEFLRGYRLESGERFTMSPGENPGK